jgi:PPIC-type PPIASE domain
MRRSNQYLFVLLVLAGCKSGAGGGSSGDFPVPPPAAADTSDKMQLVLAEVAGLQITGADLKNHMAVRSGSDENLDSYMRNPDILQIALASFIDQFVWGEMAKRNGLKLTHEEAMQVRSLEARLLATRYVTVVQDKATPSQKDIEEFYNMNQERFLKPARVAVRHILVPTQAEAVNLLARARGGADFAELAQRYSQDENTKGLGGALGFVEADKAILGIGNDRDFQQAVLPLQPGELTVARSRLGWHVIKVEKREGGGITPLDQVSGEITAGCTTSI